MHGASIFRCSRPGSEQVVTMKVVALISGGKDSCFNMMHCVANGHEIVALANLKPAASTGKDELDSYMYQTVGHDAIDFYKGCMDLPLFRREIQGSAVSQGSDYTQSSEDEVEDLYALLAQVKTAMPEVEAVATGAILSNYQRVRVENVCSRLNLTSLAYLWQRDQRTLMSEMIESGLHAILIKVAAMGLKASHLGKSLSEMYPHLITMNERYDAHICGEGGEFESLTLDCPLFKRRLVIDELETVIHSDDAIAVVAYSRLKRAHLEDKPANEVGITAEIKQILTRDCGVEDALGENRIQSSPMNEQHSTNLLSPLKPVESLYGMDTSSAARKLCIPQTISVPPRPVLKSGHFAISGVRASSPSSTIQSQTNHVLDYIESQLKKADLTWADVSLTTVYVNDLSAFGLLNDAYKAYFGLNPPARVTVEVNLPATILVQIDCTGYCPSNKMIRKENLHVQSISYWAPANIGPYSQACKTNDHVYVAGQIGLIPESMALPTPPSLIAETTLSLRSLNRVLSAVNTSLKDDTAGCVCYISSKEYVDTARQKWALQCSSGVPILYVTVPRLPRDAMIEWAVTCQTPQASSNDDDDSDEDERPPSGSVLKSNCPNGDIYTNSWKSWTRGTVGCIIGTVGVTDHHMKSREDLLPIAVQELLVSAVSQQSGKWQPLALRIFCTELVDPTSLSKALQEWTNRSQISITFASVSAIHDGSDTKNEKIVGLVLNGIVGREKA